MPLSTSITFIGGGNMASAIIGGLIKQGHSPEVIHIVEPWDEQRQRLRAQFPGVALYDAAGPSLPPTDMVVWAIKPQVFKEVALASAPTINADALHLSVAAGISSDNISHWTGSERVVRAMPNTPALVGLGMTGLFARDAVTADDRKMVDTVVATTGSFVWCDSEAQLDAVTALSGSGPAYVFYFLEAMRDTGVEMGLSPELAMELATGTFIGAATLAQRSDEPPQTLRDRVTSKAGVTFAALSHMEAQGVKAHFQGAMRAAKQRSQELGKEFGD
ncbi:pyrroline-5-carboxylate reductase [Hydrogenophaga sp. 5NK40-0174]|uniref:pyrroline-5-carboxylate reductase n=1 Tax=Hydrogenophaga sp. 5NK40-0174 TaxID=3127649 RepID=UPI0031085BA7